MVDYLQKIIIAFSLSLLPQIACNRGESHTVFQWSRQPNEAREVDNAIYIYIYIYISLTPFSLLIVSRVEEARETDGIALSVSFDRVFLK